MVESVGNLVCDLSCETCSCHWSTSSTDTILLSLMLALKSKTDAFTCSFKTFYSQGWPHVVIKLLLSKEKILSRPVIRIRSWVNALSLSGTGWAWSQWVNTKKMGSFGLFLCKTNHAKSCWSSDLFFLKLTLSPQSTRLAIRSKFESKSFEIR